MEVERVSPRDAVLVLIDVQNDFCHPEGSAARAGFDVAAVAPAVDRLVVLVAAARAAGIPRVFVRTTHDETVDSVEWRHRLEPGIGPDNLPAPVNCRTTSWGAQFHRIEPEPGEPVVIKHRYSAFHGTDLVQVLHRIGRRSLLFTGFTTNVCVETSLRDGLSHDFLVSVVEDCCAAFDGEEHDGAITNIGRYFGAVVMSADVIDRWRSS